MYARHKHIDTHTLKQIGKHERYRMGWMFSVPIAFIVDIIQHMVNKQIIFPRLFFFQYWVCAFFRSFVCFIRSMANDHLFILRCCCFYCFFFRGWEKECMRVHEYIMLKNIIIVAPKDDICMLWVYLGEPHSHTHTRAYGSIKMEELNAIA